MTFSEYMDAVEDGHALVEKEGPGNIFEFPEDPRVPTPPSFANKAGVIFNMAWGKFEHLSIIESHAGAVRSNHYHQTDSHFMTVLDGKMLYYWRIDGQKTQMIELERGQVVFTPPMVVHATFFPVSTRIIALSRKVRTAEAHESDLVRVKLIEVVGGKPAVV